jgi:hypothetical protein
MHESDRRTKQKAQRNGWAWNLVLEYLYTASPGTNSYFF